MIIYHYLQLYFLNIRLKKQLKLHTKISISFTYLYLPIIINIKMILNYILSCTLYLLLVFKVFVKAISINILLKKILRVAN